MEVCLRNQALAVTVSTMFGAIRAFSVRAGGRDISLMRSVRDHRDGSALDTACFPLIPFGNRVRGNRFAFGGKDYGLTANSPTDPLYLHGDGWLKDWSLEDVGDDSLSLALMVRGESRSPYCYDGFQSFRLIGGCLEICLRVVNRGEETLPFGLGWHPYFPLTTGTTLMAPATGFWTEDGDHLPDRRSPAPNDLDFGAPRRLPDHWVNNVFDGWTGVAEIHWPEWGCGLSITADPPLFHYMVFTPGRRREAERGADYFCFEPMSHRPGGHHSPDLSGLFPLVPGTALEARIRLEANVPAFSY